MNLPPRGPMNSGPTDHGTDTWDTIDWLIENIPNNNGRVGITGVSYGGFLTLMALIDPHPALKAAIPVNPMVDGWIGDDWFHNGAFRPVMLDYIYTQTGNKESDYRVPHGYYDFYSAVLEAGSVGEFGKRYNADRLESPARQSGLYRLLEAAGGRPDAGGGLDGLSQSAPRSCAGAPRGGPHSAR